MSLGVSDALPDEIPLDSLKSVLPPLEDGGQAVNVKESKNFVLGRNMHGSSLEITEPEHDDEVTGEKDAYMASVLARYRKSLTEKTKYHLGAQAPTYLSQPLWWIFVECLLSGYYPALHSIPCVYAANVLHESPPSSVQNFIEC
jgi:hypothetical protein